MFDKLQKLKKIKALRDKMSQETLTQEKQGIKVVVNGNMEVEQVVLNDTLSVEQQQKLVKNLINKAFRKIRRRVAKKVQQDL